MSSTRAVHHFVSPQKEVNAGLWSLFAGTTVFLGLRIYCKLRRGGLWWDDYILFASWAVLLATDTLISYEFATGYVVKTWNDRMLILVSISSCLTTAGQAWSKTAFAVTLLRMTNWWQRAICWAIIIILNVILVLKVFVDFAKYCGKPANQNWWRMSGFCIDYEPVQNIKQAGNIFNIVADFVLALFPWMVTWKLKISKKEKIALCVTMSLGIVVAIISAIRTAWMVNPKINAYNDYYFWRQGLSMVWYSSEVAGTIMVQCVPVMRPLVQEMHTSLTSAKLDGDTKRRTITLNNLQKKQLRDIERDADDDKLVSTQTGSMDDFILTDAHTVGVAR
ncbi:hypothetical protein ACMFMG_003720 [Clarireedia jacksonii]